MLALQHPFHLASRHQNIVKHFCPVSRHFQLSVEFMFLFISPCDSFSGQGYRMDRVGNCNVAVRRVSARRQHSWGTGLCNLGLAVFTVHWTLLCDPRAVTPEESWVFSRTSLGILKALCSQKAALRPWSRANSKQLPSCPWSRFIYSGNK